MQIFKSINYMSLLYKLKYLQCFFLYSSKILLISSQYNGFYLFTQKGLIAGKHLRKAFIFNITRGIKTKSIDVPFFLFKNIKFSAR